MKISGLAAVAALMATVAACGGGSSASAPAPTPVPAPPPASVGTAGVFYVNYAGQFNGVYTFLDDGNFYGVHFVDGVGLAGHPHGLLSAANSVGAPQPISWANFIDDAGQVGAQEPAGKFGRTFDAAGLHVFIQGSMGSFSATATAQRPYGDGSSKTLYGDPIPMATLAGTYSGVLRTVGIDTREQPVAGLAIDAGGVVGVTVGACTFTGTLAPHGKTGIFDAPLQTSGSGCGLNAAMSGIVTPLSVIGGKPELAVQLDSADNAQTAVFVVTKD